MTNATEKKLQTIVHVEDEEDIRTVTRLALEDLGGLQVTSCGTADAAIAALDRSMPDLILMDVMMPGQTGPELLARLKERYGPALSPVVFMTAKVLQKERQSYETLGCLGTITKPFDPLNLAQELSTLWQKHHAAA